MTAANGNAWTGEGPDQAQGNSDLGREDYTQLPESEIDPVRRQISNAQFLRTLTRGHPGRPWVTAFAEDPNKATKREWAGRQALTAGDVPGNDGNAYFATATFPAGATGRLKGAAVAVIAIVLDDIGADGLGDLPPYSWALETSPFNHQVGYALIPGEDIIRVQTLLRAMTAAGHAISDRSGNSIGRYVRLPNGINTKETVIADAGSPFPSRMADWWPERRFSTDELASAFGIGAATVNDRGARGNSSPETDDELREAIVSCAAFHDPLVKLAARFVGRGMSQDDVVAALAGIMDAAAANLPDSSRRVEWAARRDEIGRTVRSAAEKYRDPRTKPTRGETGPSAPPPPEAGDAGPWGDTAETHRSEWPEPQELTTKLAPEPYPADALPETIRLAVEEVAGFVQAPVPLVAGSALAAVSVACQGYVNVQRAEKLQGPVGLFLLSIADSGERKSTCDGFFATAIRDWEAEQAEALAPDLERYTAELDAWGAERDGLLSAIKAATAKGKDTRSLKADLVRIQATKPEAPRVPRVLLGDETPENLAWSLAKIWPAAGVLSSEAGVILGAHGMGKESVLRNLALLNVLWDGGVLPIGRRTSESFTLRGARLTVGLQVQGAALRDFFERTGALARGVGFLARFLVAWPDSTQGQRMFREPPKTWPSLAAFHARLTHVLREPPPIGDDGGLSPALLTLAPDAKGSWVAFHDAIEVELADGGELRDVRDVASKTADNAARLGALFHLFEGGIGPIGLDAFEGASRIAAWHLNESRRFFGELALPAGLADAARLDGWLIDYCRRERTYQVGKNHARQHGPLRDGKRLDAAIRELYELDRLQVRKDGRRTTLAVNPALVEVAP